jgi:Rho termination factor, N-terminal domain
MAQQAGNQTPNTPTVSETELREMKVDELREAARDEGVAGTADMRKEQLVRAVAEARAGEADGGGAGAGPDGGRLRTGTETSKSLKYSQEVTSPDDDPERPGRSLATTNHQVIKEWAEARGGTPATVEGTEHGDHLGVLRFDFGGGSDNLRHVSWEEWFGTFDARRLNFIYQEQRSDGSESNFFRLESPDREDG